MFQKIIIERAGGDRLPEGYTDVLNQLFEISSGYGGKHPGNSLGLVTNLLGLTIITESGGHCYAALERLNVACAILLEIVDANFPASDDEGHA